MKKALQAALPNFGHPSGRNSHLATVFALGNMGAIGRSLPEPRDTERRFWRAP